jgi:putative signal transducing protein
MTLPGTPPEVVWFGNDPVLFGAVLAVLKENEIQVFDMVTHSHLLQGGPAGQLGQNVIFVRADQVEQARKVIDEFLSAFQQGD